jgi:hypothetical protein
LRAEGSAIVRRDELDEEGEPTMRTTRITATTAMLLAAMAFGAGPASASRAARAPATAVGTACTGQWAIVPSPSPGTNIQSLLSVDALSASEAFAVGFAGYQDEGGNFASSPLIERWDGSAWSLAVPHREQQGALADVEAIAPDDVWAVGHSGLESLDYRPLILHFDGTRWHKVPSPKVVQGYLLGIDAIAPDDIWAVGVTIGVFDTLIEHWDGSSWTLVDHPTPRSDYVSFGSLDARATDDAWIVGSYLDHDAIARTLAEHWDGTAWTVVPTPNVGPSGSTLSAVSAVASNDVWASGTVTVSTSRSAALLAHWDGMTWAAIPPERAGKTSGFDGITAGSVSEVWAVGFFSNSQDAGVRTLIEHSGGTAFTQVPSPNANEFDNRLLSVAASPDGDAWAVGFYQTQDINRTLTMHWCP